MEIKVPEVGESVREAQVAKWHQADGASVAKDAVLCELETDKITLELHAEAAGILAIRAQEGETVAVGAVIGTIAESAVAAAGEVAPEAAKPAAKKAPPAKKAAATIPVVEKSAPPPSRQTVAPPSPAPILIRSEEPAPYHAESTTSERRSERKAMSPIRKRIAERLVAVRQQTAMLTTFNEADMSRVQALRQHYRDAFVKRHGIKLGLMSFFVKASVEALRSFPEVNARIDGSDIVYQHFYDVGIAIGADKGLVVPVLRDADRLHFAEIEQGIATFAEKIAKNQLTLADLEGGTFTITNGGIYGSLLSTPILNPPQSAVLGMHSIQERPVVRDGAIVIRPMMNLALSYDHRLVDGRQAVSFLKQIKEYIEAPEEMLLEL
ncbi:MAG: dihydrolipoamide succinyltransferase [Desulfuromonadales bacterium GWC2_61_20]|nr:MAG: dihydrolipoamide succinyltransferase [Desulfuromonadales bacterium GWC2_61_20]HAD03813.1 dihydrolipoyllysine-residue succinyltransferase [Desulfuromonas sp.]